MCEFVSWIEIETPDNKTEIWYLTNHELFGTKRGREYMRVNPCRSDWIGHGAIRSYWDIPVPKGAHRECTDFSTPDNFPAEIVADIKASNFSRIGLGRGLLTAAAWEEHEAIKRAALEEYPAIKQPALEKYQAIKRSAWEKYPVTERSALEKYQATERAALEKYQAAKLKAFWDLFSDPQNRAEQWR